MTPFLRAKISKGNPVHIFALLLCFLLALNVSNTVNADVLLRCEGKSGVQVKGMYRPNNNETCIKGRDLCVSEVVDFWLIKKDEAIHSSLYGSNIYKKNIPLTSLRQSPMGWVFFSDEKSGHLLQINPTTGEYYYTATLDTNIMTREGTCEQFRDKKLFKR